MRLQQFLARSGIASRRKAEDLIRAGRVSINDQIVEIGAVVQTGDIVRLDGERVRMPQKNVVIALHKPKGYTTTHEDEHAEKLVYELVPQHPGLHSVGRLDKDTEGLLLLTTDGHLTQLLTHPRNQVRKLYRAWCKRGRVSKEVCQQLVQGVMLGDGLAQALEAQPVKDGIKLVLAEGRKREVRRMLGKVGHPVERLVRLAVGPIELGELEVGHWRYLTQEEIKLLHSNTGSLRLRKPAQAQRQKPAAAPSKRKAQHRPEAKSPQASVRAKKGAVESSSERLSTWKRQGTTQRSPNRRPNTRTGRADKT
ncbi:pseudouridine synthase [uncultured Meiothermus sp.]|jgi:23S rRNA pseudouridine2605 synthase|uniref:pseudouridine synthase n=1 Tax=uncultured Meiothermus sp. TaxID=157471 RepID=UPI00261EF4AA|nr:pseudouridine synthase [uncultured Meiothermus sp.]